MNLYRPSDLLAVHCHSATCSLASVALSPSFLLFLVVSKEGREIGLLGGGGREEGCVEEGWVS